MVYYFYICQRADLRNEFDDDNDDFLFPDPALSTPPVEQVYTEGMH